VDGGLRVQILLQEPVKQAQLLQRVHLSRNSTMPSDGIKLCMCRNKKFTYIALNLLKAVLMLTGSYLGLSLQGQYLLIKYYIHETIPAQNMRIRHFFIRLAPACT
jgi:hypothetical protein